MIRRSRLLFVATAAAALLLSACGGDSQRRGADQTTPPTVATTKVAKTATTTAGGAMTEMTEALGTSFTIAAKNVAFVPTKLTIPAKTDVDITFDNQDAGVPHNLHIDTPTPVKTDVKNGAGSDVLHLKVDKPGKYNYMCDVHPTMAGTLTVR